MTDSWRVRISSPPDREKLVAEVFYDNIQLAEISHETDSFVVEFYPRPDGKAWSLSFEETMDVLNHAKKRLSERTGAA